jgi:HPr kinase/phosphorylase
MAKSKSSLRVRSQPSKKTLSFTVVGSAKHSNETGSQVVVSAGLLKIFGVGTLIIGDSGIGKSESSLELIARGHKFVSDDVVKIYRDERGRLHGQSPHLTRNFMEIRGLGIINIKEIFGTRAILDETPIDLVVRLKKWSKKMEIDRLGLRFPEDYLLAGSKIPQLHIPVAPGRNIATLIEVACRVFLLRKKGYQAAQDIIRRLDKKLASKNEKSEE